MCGVQRNGTMSGMLCSRFIPAALLSCIMAAIRLTSENPTRPTLLKQGLHRFLLCAQSAIPTFDFSFRARRAPHLLHLMPLFPLPPAHDLAPLSPLPLHVPCLVHLPLTTQSLHCSPLVQSTTITAPCQLAPCHRPGAVPPFTLDFPEGTTAAPDTRPKSERLWVPRLSGLLSSSAHACRCAHACTHACRGRRSTVSTAHVWASGQCVPCCRWRHACAYGVLNVLHEQQSACTGNRAKSQARPCASQLAEPGCWSCMHCVHRSPSQRACCSTAPPIRTASIGLYASRAAPNHPIAQLLL